jgi:hypothetical protein
MFRHIQFDTLYFPELQNNIAYNIKNTKLKMIKIKRDKKMYKTLILLIDYIFHSAFILSLKLITENN